MNSTPITEPVTPLDVRSRVARFTALLAVAETGVGSLLHAFHVPLAGHALSLNQILILAWSAEPLPYRDSIRTTAQISLQSSLLKSLSPAGKKLTPMAAILTQGLLFTLGLVLLGPTLLGMILGAALSSVWAFAQPLLIVYVVFGGSFFEALLKESNKIGAVFSLPADWLFHGFAAAIVIKLCLAVGVAVLAKHARPETREAYFQRMKSYAEKFPKPLNRRRSTWQELRSPLLLVSFAFSLAFFFIQEERTVQAFWTYALRPLAVYVVFSILIRIPPFTGWIARIPAMNHLR